jgi:hypothetical protein
LFSEKLDNSSIAYALDLTETRSKKANRKHKNFKIYHPFLFNLKLVYHNYKRFIFLEFVGKLDELKGLLLWLACNNWQFQGLVKIRFYGTVSF